MKSYEIVKDAEHRERLEARFNKSSVRHKYGEAPLEVNIYHYPKGSGFSIDSPGGEESAKTYFVIRGRCKHLETGDSLEPGDILVIRDIGEMHNLYMIEDTDLLVHAVNSRAYANVGRSVAQMTAVLGRIQEKDSYTEQHCARVFGLVYRMALALGYKGNRIYNVLRAARYHDVGKIHVEAGLLTKPGPLEPEEVEAMRRHVILGRELIRDAFGDEIFALLSQHHERMDGSGYPLGLAGDAISEEGRILAICDSFDAMTSERPYKRAMAEAEALAELQDLAGTKYDARLVGIFAGLFGKGAPLPG